MLATHSSKLLHLRKSCHQIDPESKKILSDWRVNCILNTYTVEAAARNRDGRGSRADLADELAPLVVGRVEDAAHRGLAGGGEGSVGEGEVQAGSDLGGPPVLHLPPHDLPAGAEPVQAQEPRRRPLPRRPDVVPLLAAER
jgi:hypothetical protein